MLAKQIPLGIYDSRSLTPQLGDRAFKLARRFHRRSGIADAAPGNKDRSASMKKRSPPGSAGWSD
jgi:hypothetical protein